LLLEVDLRQRWRQWSLGLIGSFWKRVFPLICAFAPTLIFVAFFLSQEGLGGAQRKPLLTLLKDFFSFSPLISFDLLELVPALALGLLFATAFSLSLAKRIASNQVWASDGFLILATFYVMLYFVSPDSISRGTEINTRLLLYPFFALILWFGAWVRGRTERQVMAVASIVISLAFLAMHTVKHAEMNGYLQEYLSGSDLISANSTLLPLVFSPQGHDSDERALERRPGSFLHAAGYIAAEKCAVEFGNYEAWKGTFPLVWRPERNPMKHLAIDSKMETEPPEVDFLNYPKRTGGTVDYVALWGMRDDQRNLAATKSVLRQLKAAYELIYVSPQRGLMRLYRRKDFMDFESEGNGRN